MHEVNQPSKSNALLPNLSLLELPVAATSSDIKQFLPMLQGVRHPCDGLDLQSCVGLSGSVVLAIAAVQSGNGGS